MDYTLTKLLIEDLEKMGTAFSTFLLLSGTLVTTVLTSIAANAAREKQWQKGKKWSLISLAVTITLVLVTLFIVIRSHLGAASVLGSVEGMAPGVMISFIILTLIMVGVSVMQIFAVIDMDRSNSKGLALDIGSAVASIIGFILAIIIIVVLL